MRETKTLALPEWKQDVEGGFTATFASLSVIDKDQDVTIPGAFKQGQRVRIASWGHNWGALPVGDGAIYADDRRAWVDARFYLDTAAGLDTYKTVKSLAELQEWSYGFEVKDQSFGEFEGRQVRFLRALDVFEVSPVMIGAGVGTGTDAIKSAGLPFGDHADRVLVDVRAFIDRAGDLTSLRAKEGRVLSEANRGRLRSLLAALQTAGVDVEELLAATEPAPKADLSALYGEFLRTQARLNGVPV